MDTSFISPIPDVLDDLRQGRMIILVDDPDRENEGDIAMLAEFCTPEAINFMAQEARGLICLPLAGEDCDRLKLDPQVPRNRSPLGTGFTVSIDALGERARGISASARAATIRLAAQSGSGAEDFSRPGHVFPLRAREGGVLVRGGQTEGIVDLARLAGCRPAGVICEIMSEDGSMARMPELIEFGKRFGLKICTVESIIAWRRRNEQLIRPVETDVPLPTPFGEFRAHLFSTAIDDKEHVALSVGLPDPPAPNARRPALDDVAWVRVHSECLTGDVFHSMRCDCGPQLDKALEILGTKKYGVLVYMRQEGRGIGLANKLRAYRLQDGGLDTVEANAALGFPPDLREYGIGAQILHFLGVRRMTLLTNNPRKLTGLAGYGLEVVDQQPLEISPSPANLRYLRAKRDKLGHLLGPIEASSPAGSGSEPG